MDSENIGNRGTVTLVACAATKLGRPAPARELYRSDLFAKSSAYAQQLGEWYILSAAHGLVHPDTVLEPYNVTLNDLTRYQRTVWSLRVAWQLAQRNIQADRCVVLAGRSYRDPIMAALRCRFAEVVIPLEGLGIGHQKQRLAQLAQVAA